MQCPLKYDAHSWSRSDDCRTLQLTGQAEYGNNRVQEIVSGTTPHRILQISLCAEYVILPIPACHEAHPNQSRAQEQQGCGFGNFDFCI